MRSTYKRSLIGISLMTTLAMMFLTIPSMMAQAPEPIKIGVVTARSGAFMYYGEMEINGLYLGIEYATGGTFEVLGRPIEIIVRDSTVGGWPNPGQAAAMAEDLILTEGVDFLQGSASSSSAAAIQAVAETYGVIFIVAPAAAASITGSGFTMHTFRTASNTDHDALTGAKWAVSLGPNNPPDDPTKIAFAAMDYVWGWDTVASWTRVIEEEEGVVVHVEWIPLGTIDFVPYLERVIAANPDVMVPVWAGAGSVELFTQISDLGIYDLMNVTSGIGDLWSLQLLGDAILGFTGMIKYGYTLPVNPVNDWLVDTWTTRYPLDTLPVQTPGLTMPVPDLFVASGFAAGQAIVYAIEAAGSTAAADLIPALQNLEFTSPKGWMKLRDVDHQALQEMYIATIVRDYTVPGYETIGFLRPEPVATLSPEETAPPVTPIVDINEDHVINLWDKWVMNVNWGPLFTPTNPDYNPRADVNHDTRVNLWDKWILNANWGQTW